MTDFLRAAAERMQAAIFDDMDVSVAKRIETGCTFSNGRAWDRFADEVRAELQRLAPPKAPIFPEPEFKLSHYPSAFRYVAPTGFLVTSVIDCDPGPRLTPRERHVLGLVSRGERLRGRDRRVLAAVRRRPR